MFQPAFLVIEGGASGSGGCDGGIGGDVGSGNGSFATRYNFQQH